MQSTPDRRLRVAVVYGGRSSEHGISVVSAGSVIAALDPDRYEVVPVGITTEGRWQLTATDPSRMAIAGRETPHVGEGTEVVLSPDPHGGGLVALGGGDLPAVDVVFPVLHGRFGEDGTVQGLFDLAGIPYVGSGVFASAAAMDKEMTKKLLRADGLDVGAFAVLHRGDPVLAADLEHLGLPVFVKPARAGSSVGITRVRDWSELADAVRLALEHDDKVLVEAAQTGHEVECGVLEDADGVPRASVPAQIRLKSGHDWYDFEAKYLDDACEFDVPADLPPDVTRAVQDAAVAAFRSLDCAGLARVDFFVHDDGRLVVNEVNTLPGFTPVSMFPRMWAASGVPYPELVDLLVASALRHGAR
ncbi:D-alanine--D-alanine ligase family protein [Jatrophihabitans sp. YIM 134969]